MSGHESGEYELADLPEPPRPKGPAPASGQPLPRLWKTEPEEDEEEAKPGEKPSKDQEVSPPPAKKTLPGGTTRSRGTGSQLKAKAKSSDKDGERSNKVLVEQTPAFDTYEARQRGRLIMGGLLASIFVIFGWIGYRLFVYDPDAIKGSTEEADPLASFGPAQPKRDLDGEARAMFKRASEYAQDGRTEQAVTLLENVVKVYKGTKTADEAKEALARPAQIFPLSLDRPAVAPEPAPEPKPAPQPAPPQVVIAQPKQTGGNASLTLPANPAELTPSRPSPLAMANSPDQSAKVPVTARPLPPGFTARTEAGIHASGWPLAIVGDRDGATMVFVPGGVFTMGNDNGPSQEAPAHQVRLSPYYVDQHEVTAGQFRLFLKETRHRGQPPHSWSEDFKKDPSDAIPMTMVSARDAQAYAEWAHKKLPTEAQWEMAARSTDGRLFPSGPDPISYSRPRPTRQIEPVKSFPEDVSPYGVYDMAGNVAEWTGDWYDQKAYRQIFNQPVDNPTGPAARPRSNQLVIKGGAKNGSASYREGMAFDKRLSYVGFRCVLPVTDTAAPVIPGVPPAPPPGAPPGTPATPPPGGQTQVPAQPF